MRVISLRHLKRKGELVKSAYCVIRLTGKNTTSEGTHTTFVRTSENDFTVDFNESFEFPLLEFQEQQGVSIEVFDKKLTRFLSEDKCVVKITLPTIFDETIFGRCSDEIVSWITLKSDSIFEDTGDIQIGFRLFN